MSILVLAFCTVVQGAEFAGGTGEPNDPYRIATAEHLLAIGDDTSLLDKHFLLVEDIDLDPNRSGVHVLTQSPIAPYLRASHGGIYGSFEGIFDGSGHVIRNLVIHAEAEEAAGLFGYIGRSAQIRNLGLDGVEIRRSWNGEPVFVGGGLAAVNDGGTILSSFAIGTVAEENRQSGGRPPDLPASAYDRVGGLIGENRGLVHACYAIVTVRGNGILGGLIGLNEGMVQFSFAVGILDGVDGRRGRSRRHGHRAPVLLGQP